MTNQNELKVEIDGVALKQVLDEKDNWLPSVEGHPQHPPYEHQVEMNDIIENEDRFIATNSTITGGGKTQSYSVPVLNNDLFTIVIFPTNALTTDQNQSITELAENYYSDKNVFIQQLTSDTMQSYREEKRKEGVMSSKALNNGTQIKKSLIHAHRNDGPSFILTNPDIFTEILTGSYGNDVRQHLEVADMVVVDEFHHARPKGKNTLIVKMDELYHRDDERCNLKRFVFLSATPDEQLSEQLENKFGFPEDDIYHHINSKDDCKPVSELTMEPSEPYNPVMPKVNTTFISGRPFSTKDKVLSEEYLPRILNFVKSGRSIVILDGVAEVNDVQLALQNHLPNKRVEKITGLTPDDTHEKLQNADVLVANSTLEVGVDIGNIEQLVYTGFNASSFMQRLGRLRAEPGKLEKAAVCFTKPDVLETFKAFRELDKSTVSRELLHNMINRQLDTTADTSLYGTEFTPIELYYGARKRAESIQGDSDVYMRRMKELIAKHFFETSEYDIRKDDVDKLWKISHTNLGKAMQSYRQSSLTALYYDERTQSVKTYSIASLLRFGDVEFLTEPEFDYRLKSIGIDNPSIYDGEKRYVQTFAWLNGFMSGEKLRNPHLAPTDQIRHMVEENPKKRYPELIKSLEFTVENTTELKGLSVLNKQLSQKLNGKNSSDIVGYVTEGHPAQIQTIYGLDEFFFTNPIANMNGQYTMALGENAQYLHCHVQENISAAEELYRQFSI